MKNLYRGKLVDRFKDLVTFRPELVKDNWVFGSLVTNDDGRTFICVHASCSSNSFVSNGITTMFEVIPETIGIYTQLNDKNGNEVFTGDILRMGFDDYCVKYNPEQACYTFYLIKDNEEVVHWGFNQSTVANLEITGNIIDTPEFLKG